MRSVEEDLTTRARIRDAALSRFAAVGYAAATVRSIAVRAGVSAALVIHHFKSKENLRAACDDLLLEHLVGADVPTATADDDDLRRSVSAALGDLSANSTLFAYLGRMLTDGGPTADQLFDRLVGATRATIDEGIADGSLRSFEDPDVLSVVLTAQGLAHIVLGAHVARALGSVELDPDTVGRMALPLLELYTHGLYADDTLLSAARSAIRTAEQR